MKEKIINEEDGLETAEQRDLRLQRQAKEVELFKQNYLRYGRIIKTVFCSVFGFLAVMFLILGIACLIIEKGEAYTIGVVYTILGAMWLCLFVMFMFIPFNKLRDAEKVYKKYKNSVVYNIPVYPSVVNPFQQKVELDELKERVEELETKLKRLENKK